MNNMKRNLSSEKAEYIKKFILNTRKIPGDVAEVGVSIGDSAEVICKNKGDVPIHLFDTFKGHPAEWIGKYDLGQTAGRHAASLESVKKRLNKYPNVFYYEGIFPFTSDPVKDKMFSFVNLDTDLYKSTLAGLEFFYPRLSVGGVIGIDDSTYILGVGCAIIDFLTGMKSKGPETWQACSEYKMNQAFIKKIK